MNRRTVAAAHLIGLAAMIPALALLLLVERSARAGTCLFCIVEDLQHWLWAAFIGFGGLVDAFLVAIVPDAYEDAFFEHLHAVSGPMYDAFCDFGGWIDSLLPDSWGDSSGEQGAAYPDNYGYY